MRKRRIRSQLNWSIWRMRRLTKLVAVAFLMRPSFPQMRRSRWEKQAFVVRIYIMSSLKQQNKALKTFYEAARLSEEKKLEVWDCIIHIIIVLEEQNC